MKMSKFYLTFLTFIIVFSLGLSSGCNKTNSLVTNPLSEVSEVTIKDYEHNSTITIDVKEDKDTIAEIYKSVESTEVTDHSDDKKGQNSSPKFSIDFKYQDGTQDIILSTETGEFIYRNLSSAGWIGGSNTEIHKLLDDKLVEEK